MADEELRLRCLELAHSTDRTGRSKTDLVDRAKAFYDFVKGKEDGQRHR